MNSITRNKIGEISISDEIISCSIKRILDKISTCKIKSLSVENINANHYFISIIVDEKFSSKLISKVDEIKDKLSYLIYKNLNLKNVGITVITG